MSLIGKNAVVTGAAMGIGQAVAVRLAKDGADVAIIDINEEGLRETAKLVEAEGRKCLPVVCDLLDRDAIKASFDKIKKALGFIEILHNNAGQSARQASKPFGETDIEQWDFVVDLNLRATADCTREVCSEMRERGTGRIITTATSYVYWGGEGVTDYTAAKAGVIGFTRSLALELAPYGVTVNCVCPGVTMTRALEQVPKNVMDEAISKIPMKKAGTPECLAGAVSFFASPGSWYVTGTHLLVNGAQILI